MRQRNRYQVCGNLGADPQEFSTKGGQKGCRFELCNNQTFGPPGNPQHRQNWFTVVVWNPRLVGLVLDSLEKGQAVQVEGELRMREFNRIMTIDGAEIEVPTRSYDLIASQIRPDTRLGS